MVVPLYGAEKSSVRYGELPLFISCLHFMYVMFVFIGYFVMLLTCNDIGVGIVSIKRFDYINAILVFGGNSLQHTALQYAQQPAR